MASVAVNNDIIEFYFGVCPVRRVTADNSFLKEKLEEKQEEVRLMKSRLSEQASNGDIESNLLFLILCGIIFWR